MTPQEIKQDLFDRCARHLLAQGRKATTPEMARDKDGILLGAQRCFYRAPNGDRCAVGGLLDPEANFAELDRLGAPVPRSLSSGTALDLRQLATLVADGLKLPPEEVPWELLRELQNVHDCKDVMVWSCALENLAISFGLSPAAAQGGPS